MPDDRRLDAHNQDEHDPIDTLLIGAIATYSAEAPDPRLGNKIAARVHSRQPMQVVPLRPSYSSQVRIAAALTVLLVGGAAAWLTFHPDRQSASATLIGTNRDRAQTDQAQHPQHAEFGSSPQQPTQLISGNARRPRRTARITLDRATSRAAEAGDSPSPDVFPTPAPLSAEERALVLLATKAPRSLVPPAGNTPADAPDQAGELAPLPIAIAAIHIEPLTPLDPQSASANAKP